MYLKEIRQSLQCLLCGVYSCTTFFCQFALNCKSCRRTFLFLQKTFKGHQTFKNVHSLPLATALNVPQDKTVDSQTNIISLDV